MKYAFCNGFPMCSCSVSSCAVNLREDLEDNGIQVSDLVKIRRRDRRKLESRFEGPFIVLSVDQARHSAEIEPLAGGKSIERSTTILVPWMEALETSEESGRASAEDNGAISGDQDRSWADLVSEEEGDDDVDGQEYRHENYLILDGTKVWVSDKMKQTWYVDYVDVFEDLLVYMKKGKWIVGVKGTLTPEQRDHLEPVRGQLHPWTRAEMPTSASVARMRKTRKSKDGKVVTAMKEILG